MDRRGIGRENAEKYYYWGERELAPREWKGSKELRCIESI